MKKIKSHGAKVKTFIKEYRQTIVLSIIAALVTNLLLGL